jgi:hypothetical protein
MSAVSSTAYAMVSALPAGFPLADPPPKLTDAGQ